MSFSTRKLLFIIYTSTRIHRRILHQHHHYCILILHIPQANDKIQICYWLAALPRAGFFIKDLEGKKIRMVHHKEYEVTYITTLKLHLV